MWVSGDVASPGQRIKIVQHASVGRLGLMSTSLAVNGMPEHRIVVYTPNDEESRARIEQLRDMEDPMIGCPAHGRRLSEVTAEEAGKRVSRAL
jgi:hypothetical protein